jgi:ribonuclease HIII
MTPIKKTSFTFTLTPEQQQNLKELLSAGNYKRKKIPYTTIAVEASDFTANLYTSGKLLVQGRGAEDFVLFVLEPNILLSAGTGYEDILDPSRTTPHMGSDESGKGDFFGPLVACAVYVNPSLARSMQEMGVRDCKLMSDKAIFTVGRKVRDLLGTNRYALVSIGPEAYNRLYLKMRNVNNILAWAHARCIENLLNNIPSCPRAVADQFGTEALIKQALMKKGRTITLEQHHKAESDIAVAAASVLARESFLRSLERIGETHKINVYKGASEQVREAAIELIKNEGPAALVKNCKCHFRTTEQVLAACGATRDDLGELGQATSRIVKK